MRATNRRLRARLTKALPKGLAKAFELRVDCARKLRVRCGQWRFVQRRGRHAACAGSARCIDFCLALAANVFAVLLKRRGDATQHVAK